MNPQEPSHPQSEPTSQPIQAPQPVTSYTTPQGVNVVINQAAPGSAVLVEKNYIVALLLSIFLGTFGIDRFYLGHVGFGLIKLFTGGLFGIWWLIDVILIATKNIRGITWVK